MKEHTEMTFNNFIHTHVLVYAYILILLYIIIDNIVSVFVVSSYESYCHCFRWTIESSKDGSWFTRSKGIRFDLGTLPRTDRTLGLKFIAKDCIVLVHGCLE